MALKRHHKIIIGSFSSILIIILISNTLFIYILYAQLQISNNRLENEIIGLQADTQNKINELTTNIIEAKENLNKLGTSLSELDEAIDIEIGELKASVGEDFSGFDYIRVCQELDWKYHNLSCHSRNTNLYLRNQVSAHWRKLVGFVTDIHTHILLLAYHDDCAQVGWKFALSRDRSLE